MKGHSLVRAPEHNGVQGKVGAFDASTGRWSVPIEPDGRNQLTSSHAPHSDGRNHLASSHAPHSYSFPFTP